MEKAVAECSLMDLIGRNDDLEVQIPNDIHSTEDFLAWCQNIDRYPCEPEIILAKLENMSVDGEGKLKEDFETASRTFFKGFKKDNVSKWVSYAFNSKRR